MGFVSVERIQVLADRVLFDIRIPNKVHRRTDSVMAARAVSLRPNLPIHACVNSKGNTFGVVLSNTPMPHLIEHCTIDFLTEGSRDECETYVGTSRWTDAEAGRAQIQISMKDDLAVLRAFKQAVGFIEEEVIA